MAKMPDPINIQLLLDPELLAATDEFASEAGVDRSAFIRDALRRRIKQLQILAWEERERKSYEEMPETEEEIAEIAEWEKVQAWED